MTDQGILPLYPAAYLTWNPLPYLIETIHHWFDEPVEVKNARSSKDPVRNLTGQIWSEKDQHWKTPGIVESKPIPPPTLTELESAGQQLFDGFEVYLSPSNPKKQKASTPWKPRQRTLAQVKGYFQGYLTNGRDIYARRKHIAARLGMSVRTLARYLAFLAAEGWIETVKRTARTAIRKVLSILNLSPGTVPSSDPPIEEPPSTKVLRQQMCTPLVIVRTVYRRIRARYKPQADTKRIPTWGEGPRDSEMYKPSAEELAAFLETVA